MRCLAGIFIALLLASSAFAQSITTTPTPVGLPGIGVQRVLCSIRAANLNTTADQACIVPATVTAWAPTAIWTTNCAGTLTLAIGGVYPAAAKSGTPLVAAIQAYSSLTTSILILPLTLATGIVTTRYAVNTVYLSLTTGAGSAATCDFYVVGVDLT